MIQAGIGGAFNRELPLGETVVIRDEVTGDMGVEENNLFKDLFDMGFMKPDIHPYSNGRLVNSGIAAWELSGLSLASGITVNEITTSKARINFLLQNTIATLSLWKGQRSITFACRKAFVLFNSDRYQIISVNVIRKTGVYRNPLQALTRLF